MSNLSIFNNQMRLDAIKAVLRNHPVIMDMLITSDGNFNTEATPEFLDLDDSGDILVRLAWDIWNGGGESELDKILNQLSQEDFAAFIDGMKGFYDLRQKIHYAYISGSEND